MRHLLHFTVAVLLTSLWLTSLEIPSASAESARRPGLIAARKDLFSHGSHQKHFEKLQVNCTDCHTFSIQQEKRGPVGKGVREKFTKPGAGICHQCHLGKVQQPVRNQCSLCHEDKGALKPDDHSHAWKMRHGKLAAADRDSCAACHQSSECTGCHIKQNSLMPQVHRPNFRLSHSIQARGEPESCVVCHKVSSFCIDCHSGRKR